MLREVNHELVNSSLDAHTRVKRSLNSRVKAPVACPVTISAPENRMKKKKKKKKKNTGTRGNDEFDLNGESVPKPLHVLAKKGMNVVLSLVNGRTIGSGENKEEYLEDMNPSPMSWHKNCKTTFGIANNNGKGTNISVFDRSGNDGGKGSSNIVEILDQVELTAKSGGAVPVAPFSPSSSSKMSKRRDDGTPVSLCSAPCATPSVANETTIAMAFRPDRPNEIAVTTKQNSCVRVFSKVLTSVSSNNNGGNTGTTWKIERLQNDETEMLLDAAVSDVKGTHVLDRLVWSPDGSLLATASSNGSTIRIWDVDAKKSTAMSSGNMSGLSSVIRSIKRRKTFRVPKSKSEIMKALSSIDSFKETLVPIEIDKKRNGIVSLAFSGSGRHLAAVSKDGSLTIWTKKSGVWLENGFSSAGKVTAFAWGPSPKAAAMRGNKRMREYDGEEIGVCCVETALVGSALRSTEKRHISCAALQVAPDGTTRAALPISFPKIPGEEDPSEAAAITSCAWDDTASRLVFGHADGKVRVYATIIHPVLTVRAIGTFCREERVEYKDDEELADEGENLIEAKDIAASLQFSSGDSATSRLNDRAIVDRILAVSWGDGATSFVPMTFSASAAV